MSRGLRAPIARPLLAVGVRRGRVSGIDIINWPAPHPCCRTSVPLSAVDSMRLATDQRVDVRGPFRLRSVAHRLEVPRTIRLRRQPPNKRLKLAGLTRVKESECLCPAEHRVSFINSCGGGPCLPAA